MEQSVYSIGGSALVFTLSLLFGMVNGFRNAPLVVASVISTRAISPGRAFLLCALAEFVGIFLFGSAVVMTISQKMFGDVFQGSQRDVHLVLSCGIGAAILWGLFCHWRSLPTSNNHALFAGISGAGWATWGVEHLLNPTLLMAFLVLVLLPMAALLLSMCVTWSIRTLGEWMTPKVVGLADRLHIWGALIISAVDGSNNGQISLSLAMLSLGLLSLESGSGELKPFVPLWLMATVAGAISLGVLMEGRRIVKKLGMSFFQLEIPQGLGSQVSAAVLVIGSLIGGFPASVAHVMTGSILGAGVAKNPRSVRWGVAGEVVLSWVLTIPACLVLAYLAVFMVRFWRGM